MEREIHMGNKTRRLAAVLLAVLLLLGLNACGTASDLSSEETSGGIKGAGIKEPETEAPNGEDSGAEHPGKENFGKGNFGTTDPEPTDEGQPLTTEGQAALERLWSLMEDQPKAPLAAACLGEPTWRDPDSLKEYFREHFSYMVEELPFLLEIPEDRILGEGELLYCVVPRDGNTSLAVNRVSWKSSGSGNRSRPESQVEEVLYRSENAQPLLVFVDYDFMDENDRRWPDIQISAVAGNGGAVVWYPDCYPETFIINAPIDEDYDPLILELENLTGSGPDNQANGGDGWTAPTEMELANTYWYGSGDWYMMLSVGPRLFREVHHTAEPAKQRVVERRNRRLPDCVGGERRQLQLLRLPGDRQRQCGDSRDPQLSRHDGEGHGVRLPAVGGIQQRPRPDRSGRL